MCDSVTGSSCLTMPPPNPDDVQWSMAGVAGTPDLPENPSIAEHITKLEMQLAQAAAMLDRCQSTQQVAQGTNQPAAATENAVPQVSSLPAPAQAPNKDQSHAQQMTEMNTSMAQFFATFNTNQVQLTASMNAVNQAVNRLTEATNQFTAVVERHTTSPTAPAVEPADVPIKDAAPAEQTVAMETHMAQFDAFNQNQAAFAASQNGVVAGLSTVLDTLAMLDAKMDLIPMRAHNAAISMCDAFAYPPGIVEGGPLPINLFYADEMNDAQWLAAIHALIHAKAPGFIAPADDAPLEEKRQRFLQYLGIYVTIREMEEEEEEEEEEYV
ncbi:hypothetical protein DFH06DRAFT_1239570 [Mycena polygramma]|nr:hypothetical protein DFH06DRAFT_1239570 [Mycena polygramma]